MLNVRFELNLNPGNPKETAYLANQAEELGYARVGVWDSPAQYREPWVTLAAVAQATRRVHLGTNVTNPLTRHPVVTASAAATLDELAPGRVYIGIGSGDSGVYNLGYTASPLAALGEYIVTVRSLLERGYADFRGQRVRLPWAKRHIPIYMSAHGAKAIRLAGTLADGVIMGLGISSEVVRGCLQVLAESAQQAGRSLRDIDVWWASAGIHIDPRPGEAIRQAGWIVATPTHHLARFTLDGKFVPDQFREGIRRLGASYDIESHVESSSEQRQLYEQLAQDFGVRDYLLERFLIAGTPAEVEDKLKRLALEGATQFAVAMTTGGMEQVRWCAELLNSGSSVPPHPRRNVAVVPPRDG